MISFHLHLLPPPFSPPPPPPTHTQITSISITSDAQIIELCITFTPTNCKGQNSRIKMMIVVVVMFEEGKGGSKNHSITFFAVLFVGTFSRPVYT